MNQELIDFVLSGKKIIGRASIFSDYGKNDRGKTVYIQEVAGRDSYAALKKVLSERPFKNSFIVLSMAIAPTEYGDKNIIIQTFNIFKSLLQKRKIPYAISISRDNLLWADLCGKKVSKNIKKYGFYTPCISCHAYFHILRALVALDVGAMFIISGERVSHSGKIKINQTEKVLKAYEEILKPFGIEILYPVKDVEKESEIAKLIETGWEEEKNQMECVFSGNYLNEEGKNLIDEKKIDSYLKDFLIPEGIKAINSYLGHLEVKS